MTTASPRPAPIDHRTPIPSSTPIDPSASLAASPDRSHPATLGRYGLWIAAAFAINLGITYGLTLAGMNRRHAFAIALLVVTTINFFGLRWFVYQSRSGAVGSQARKFLLLNGVQRSLEYAGFVGLDATLSPPLFVAVPLVLGLSTMMRYVLYRRFVFVETAER